QMHIHIKKDLSRSAYADQHLSPEELLRKADCFQHWTKNIKDRPVTRSIGDNEKDFEKLIIKMWGDDIITGDTIDTYWRDVKDLIICHRNGDTIGYIPQAVRNDAFKRILEAEKKKDYDLVYKLFQDAMVAIPCTPEEYKELKAKGLN
ncbi:MAG: hypothetical protein SOZ18_03760, partial [Phocaeicola sp.]|nr:hypothetical protein [Phocaeicola sp.]